MKEEVYRRVSVTLSTKGRVRRNVLRPHVLPLLRKSTLDMMMVMRMNRMENNVEEEGEDDEYGTIPS